MSFGHARRSCAVDRQRRVGRTKIESLSRGTVGSLEPAEDHVVNEDSGLDWVSLPDYESMRPFRHDWLMQQRPRQHTPVLVGMARHLSEEEQTQRLLLDEYIGDKIGAQYIEVETPLTPIAAPKTPKNKTKLGGLGLHNIDATVWCQRARAKWT
eukprot:3427316-Amphidinium_carterae.2